LPSFAVFTSFSAPPHECGWICDSNTPGVPSLGRLRNTGRRIQGASLAAILLPFRSDSNAGRVKMASTGVRECPDLVTSLIGMGEQGDTFGGFSGFGCPNSDKSSPSFGEALDVDLNQPTDPGPND
jgi:hypothetical protein